MRRRDCLGCLTVLRAELSSAEDRSLREVRTDLTERPSSSKGGRMSVATKYLSLTVGVDSKGNVNTHEREEILGKIKLQSENQR